MSVEDLTATVPANDPPPAAVPSALPADAPVAGALEAADHAPEPEPKEGWVPLPALQAERSKAKALKEQLDTVSQSAAYVPQLQQQIQQLQARLEQQPKPPAPPPAPLIADEVADALARKFELYDAAGNPDRQRARDVSGFFAGLAKAEAQQAVAPLAAVAAAERAHAFRERAAAVKDTSGQSVDPQYLQMMFNVVPQEIAADPRAAGMLVYAAAGYERFHGKPKGPAAPEAAPVVTERAGGRLDPSTPVLSDWEVSMLNRMGINKDAYLKHAKGYKTGVPNVLE